MQAIIVKPSFNSLKIRLFYDDDKVSLEFTSVFSPPIGICGLRFLKSWESLVIGEPIQISIAGLPVIEQTDTKVSLLDSTMKILLNKELCTNAFQQILEELRVFYQKTPTVEQLRNDPKLLLQEIASQSYDSNVMHKNIDYLLDAFETK